MKKAIFLSLGIVSSGLAANIFMGPEYAKELCNVWNNTPRLTDELGVKVKAGLQFQKERSLSTEKTAPQKSRYS